MDATIDNDGSADTDPDAKAGPATIPVSADAVSADGTPPAVGDTVTFTVSGTVTSVNGDIVMVTPQTANGQVLPVPGPQPSESDSLRSQAMDADNSSDY